MKPSDKMVRNVLRRVLAGKTEEPPASDQEDTTVGGPPTQAKPRGLEVEGRIYFYSAPPGKKIDFRNLYESLKGSAESVTSEDMKNLIQNLQEGSVDYGGDHFEWTGLMVKAKDAADEGNRVVYTYYLSPWGSYDSGRVDMVKEGDYDYPKPQVFAADESLFRTAEEVRDMVQMSSGAEVVYSMDTPSKQVAQRFLSRGMSPQNVVRNSSNDLNHVMPMYRLWAVGVGGTPEGGELRMPDGRRATDDNIGPNRKGQYKGGSRAYTALMKDAGNPDKSAPEKEEKPKEQDAPQESIGEKLNRPVSEMKPTTEREVEEETMAKSASEDPHGGLRGTDGSPLGSYGAAPFGPMSGQPFAEVRKDDPKVNTYQGSHDTMVQDLVRRQHQKMKVWGGKTAADAEPKEGYIKEVGDDPNVNEYVGDFSVMKDLARLQAKPGKMKIRDKDAITKVTPSTSGTKNVMELEVPTDDPDVMEDTAKALEDLSKTVGKMQQSTTNVLKGISTSKSASVRRVVAMYLEK